jgi:cytochrome oxidase Cu insertion factor (SCO1/SenC/PrrC family)
MKLFFKYAPILLMFTISQLVAQHKNNNLPKFSITTAKNQPMPDSIDVAFFQGIISGNGGYRKLIQVRKENSNGQYTFSIPTNQPISPFTIAFWYGKRTKSTGTFYAELGDSVDIIIKNTEKDKDGIKVSQLAFSGKGAAKYNICKLINNSYIDNANQAGLDYVNEFGDEVSNNPSKGKIESTDYYKSPDLMNYLNSLFENLKSGKKNIQQILLKNKDSISPQIANYYSYERDYYYPFDLFTYLLHQRATLPEAKKVISDFYLSKIDSLTPFPNDSLFKYGLSYRNRMSDYVRYKTFYTNKGEKYPFHIQYDALKRIQNIELRNILITKFLVEGNYVFVNNNETRDSCIEDAIKTISNPELLTALKRNSILAKGNKFSDFSFTDTLGKKVTLNNMKGKVFMLDFYYNGCGSCAFFSQKFENEIYKEFANNSNFQVLSVNTDKKREYWMKAIKSGFYTLPTSINLCTGSAFSHPIFKKYNIAALPWVLLIDKDGRILNSNVNTLGSEEIKKMINDALNRNEKTSMTK